MHAFLLLVVLWESPTAVRIHPMYPLAEQPSWQAAVPVPIQITYDVPVNGEWEEDQTTIADITGGMTSLAQTKLEQTSFAIKPEHLIAQAAHKEQFSIRLHAPSETLQQLLDGVGAVEKVWEDDRAESMHRYEASKQTLFDAVGMNMKRIVRESLAPLILPPVLAPSCGLFFSIMRLFALFVSLVVFGECSSLLSDELVGQIEDQLSESCGDRCLDVFHDLLPLISNMTSWTDASGLHREISALNAFMEKYVSPGHTEYERLLNELENITTSSFADNSGIVSPAPNATVNVGYLRSHIPPQMPGIPCGTQAECDSIDFKINRCAHIRKSSMVAYVGANTVLSVMANLITVSCGCIFAGPANVCVLRGVPYTCVFPFYAFSGIYGLSQALYNAVTKITATCTTGGPSITG